MNRTLLVVTGLTPQVVTETLYALLHRSPPWIPDRVEVLTTSVGREKAVQLLLAEPDGWFYRFCKDFAMPAVCFSEQSITVFRRDDGQPIDDIRNESDNMAVANAISAHIRQLTACDDGELHVSMAGGRKSMGFFAGYALSLWGRRNDTLSHVLVSQDYESSPDFFYPTPYRHLIHSRTAGGELDAADAGVWLSSIPYVRLRNVLEKRLPELIDADYAEAVDAVNLALDDIRMTLLPAAGQLTLNGTPVHLQPMQFGLLALLAWQRKHNQPPLHAPVKAADDPEWREQVYRSMCRIFGQMNVPDAWEKHLLSVSVDNALHDAFMQQLSKMRTAIRRSNVLPLKELVAVTEATEGRTGNTLPRNRQRSYRLKLQAWQIDIKD